VTPSPRLASGLTASPGTFSHPPPAGHLLPVRVSEGNTARSQRQPSPGATYLRTLSMTWAL